MLDHILKTTDNFILGCPKKVRKEIGQFFTSKETAVFMAQQIDIPLVEKLYILDPRSGSGILSGALVDRLQQSPYLHLITLTCYENNSNILDLLKFIGPR